MQSDTDNPHGSHGLSTQNQDVKMSESRTVSVDVESVCRRALVEIGPKIHCKVI